jgi:hypothetical protein
MTNTYAPEIGKLTLVDSIFYHTPNGVWAPGIAFPAGDSNPTPSSSDHEGDFYYSIQNSHLWQFQGNYPTGQWADLGTAGKAITYCGTVTPPSGVGNELDLYNKYTAGEIYQKIDGQWRFIGSNKTGLPLSADAINFTDYSKTWRQANLGLLLVSDTGSSPILGTDAGLVVKKDITAGGFVGANQGELWLGHGRENYLSPPRIVLMHSTGSYFADHCDPTGQAYDTLYLTRADCSTSADLNLDSLYAQHVYAKGSSSSGNGAHLWADTPGHFFLATHNATSPAWRIGYGNGNGGLDTSQPNVLSDGQVLTFANFTSIRTAAIYGENGASNVALHGTADYATSAGSASSATYASSAGSASSASAIPVLSSDPSSPATGSIWLKT